jgi:hypothetical protein
MPDGRRGDVIDRPDPQSRRFEDPEIPLGAVETETIVTKNYPQRSLYQKLGLEAPSQNELHWLAGQIRRIGLGKHSGRPDDYEMKECVRNLSAIIELHLGEGNQCQRKIAEIMLAAFPGRFYLYDHERGMQKLLKRAKQEQVTLC